jgi:thiamine biosynthesis lipoprotein ApbE
LLDPLTGLPLERVNRLVSVIAADAWWAEAVAQQLAGCEIEEAMRVIHDAAALIVDPDGAIHHVNGYEEYLA